MIVAKSWLRKVVEDTRELLTELVEYREVLFRMTERDLRLRYKQTIMGFGWAVFMPVLNTIVFTVIFTRVATIDSGGIPYPLFAFCGLLSWNFLSSSLKFSTSSLTSNINLVTKVYFPREVFPFSAILSSLVDFLVASSLLLVLMLYFGVEFQLSLLFLPVVVLVQVVFTAAVALFLAMSNLFFRDVKYLFEVVLAVWMYASSVVYPVELLGGRLGTLLQYNPMTQIVEAYRDVALRGTLPPALPFIALSALSLGLLGVCWLVFHRAEFEFAENV